MPAKPLKTPPPVVPDKLKVQDPNKPKININTPGTQKSKQDTTGTK